MTQGRRRDICSHVIRCRDLNVRSAPTKTGGVVRPTLIQYSMPSNSITPEQTVRGQAQALIHHRDTGENTEDD